MTSATVLAQVSLFAELSEGELESLAAGLERRRYARGQTIFMRGDPGTSLYIIESGIVKIIVTSPEGKALIVNVLGAGEFFGELALLDGEPRSADAQAQEHCQLLLLPRDAFLKFLRAHIEAAIKLLAVVSRRLRQDVQLAQDAAFLDVPARLAQAILWLANSQAQPRGSGAAVMMHVTQSELAERIGATRESVNKWLRLFQRQGMINLQRGVITVLQPEELRKRIY